MRLLVLVFSLILISISPSYGRDLSETIRFGGLQRFYRVHIPKGFDGKHRLPVVMVFHGLTNDSRSMEELTGLDRVADREKFLVVYPEGVSRRWYFGEGGYRVDDVGFVLTLLDRLRAEFFVDPLRIYAVGISNGGFLVLTLACQYSEHFTAVATVAATFTQQQVKACKPTRPIPIALIHGEFDPLIPFLGGRSADGLSLLPVPDTVKRWATLNGCEPKPKVQQFPSQIQDGTTVRQTRYSTCLMGSRVYFYQIVGGGHTWPGSTKNLPMIAVGKASQNLAASDVLWQFWRLFP